MGVLQYAIILAFIAFMSHFIIDKLHTKLPLHFGGHVEAGYKRVREAFEQNFRDGWEPEGASLAVFVKGRKVVDLWGGYADKQAARIWKEDTMTVTFSTTKAVAAVCIAMLADRGRLKYDDLVSKYWPGFAKNGKTNVTIEWVMSHMAGLPYLDTTLTKEMITDHNLMRKALENEAPKRPPGRHTGYHTFTYGWLVDQIVRHTDEKHRGIGQFFREEVAKPNGIDFHIGLDHSEEYRVARVVLQTVAGGLAEVLHDWKLGLALLKFFFSSEGSPLKKSLRNSPWIDVLDKCTVNDPEQHALEQAAAIGIGNARSLASIFNLLVNGHIVSEKTMALLQKPVINTTDYVLNEQTVKGHGFFYYPPIRDNEKHLLMGHSGLGCQQVMFDMKNKIVFAYVTNGMKAREYVFCRNYMRLQNALYSALKV
ncbi:hypothetical protein V3C99_009624 [Haemonchus contortus]